MCSLLFHVDKEMITEIHNSSVESRSLRLPFKLFLYNMGTCLSWSVFQSTEKKCLDDKIEPYVAAIFQRVAKDSFVALLM